VPASQSNESVQGFCFSPELKAPTTEKLNRGIIILEAGQEMLNRPSEVLNAVPRGRGGVTIFAAALGLSIVTLHGATRPPPWVSGVVWPKPPVVDPGSIGGTPSDAIVLFNGRDLSQWDGGEKWAIKDGYAICGGNITTKRPFGDCQLHVEWATPAEVEGAGQGRGNSGVYLMGMYEIQILDSYENETSVDSQSGSVYKQRPPLVNVCRKPGEWQSFDIVFRSPRFDRQGQLLRPAYVTVFQNGVLIQDHFELLGPSGYRQTPRYSPHEAKLPLRLQYHRSPVRFRNIWIRELGDTGDDLLAVLRVKLNTTRPAP
jgi:hypothetical protein